MPATPPAIHYVTVDVFTNARFSGNPLAVVADARGLSDAQMQWIAAEFGYSESTFVLPPSDPANTARVRIFTPTSEIPFAGHPNVGTAFVIGTQATLFGKPVGNALRFEEKAGLVEVDLIRDADGTVSGAAIRAPRPLSTGDIVPLDVVASCVSLDADDIVTATHAPILISVGLPFAVAELAGLDTLAAACPNTAAFSTAARLHHEDRAGFSLFLYCRDPHTPWQIRARMFAPLDNVPEDPATGSASAALAAFLVTLHAGSDLKTRIVIEQGVEMGRRSLITLDVEKVNGIVAPVVISGDCVAVMRGTIDIRA